MTASHLSLVGVNLSGAEFGSGNHYGYDYVYPNNAEVDYYASKGMNVIRLPFKWEHLQPTLNGPLNSAELAQMDAFVNYATSKGLKVILDPHDFGGYNGQLIGSSAVPNSAFANFWSLLAGHYASNPNIIFGLMNEPNQQSASTWLRSENQAIAAIRATGAHQELLVQGSYWDSASNWTTTDNAKIIGAGIKDPGNNYAFEVHQYLDSDGSGTHSSVVSADIGVQRLTAITQWAQSTGARLFLGEFGVGTDSTSLSAMNNMLAYMAQNNNVWQGATEWGGGPWWGNYMYSVEPTNGVDKPQIAVLQKYENRKGTSPSLQDSVIPQSESLGLAPNGEQSNASTGRNFVFQPNCGNVQISDFIASGTTHDTISLPTSEFSNIADILRNMHNSESGTILTLDAHDTIQIHNVSVATLRSHPVDFRLHA